MNAEVLLRTKTAIPPARSELVRRPRLTARMNVGVKGPLTLLSAPAGFGKTQLLVQWAADCDQPIAWLTLSREDNDLLRFFRYLSSALQTVEPRLGEGLLDYVQSTERSRLGMALTLLINDISAVPKNLVLVLDEYHVLEDTFVLLSLDFLLKHLPPNLHLVIASRSELSLDLALLRAKAQVTDIGADELRLTHAEIGQFFERTMRLQLSAETIQKLEERTEGWAIGLQLAALSLRNLADPTELLRSFHGDAHYLVDFLGQEVLDRQPEDVRQFLLRCSILDVLSGPLCEAVTGMEAAPGYGSRMLDQLERANLFVMPLDEQHQWFRFHNLFADFLRHRLTATLATEIPRLHMRAASWFEQQGNLDEAFKHGLASGDLDWAADLMERNLEVLVESGEIATLTHWVKKLPHAHIHQRPWLGLGYAGGLTVAHQLDEARFWLDDVQQSVTVPDDRQSQPATTESGKQRPLWTLLGGLALVRSMLALRTGDLQQAAQDSQLAVGYLEAPNLFIRSVLAYENSMYCILLGDTVKAIEAIQETIGIARRASNLFVLIAATGQMAEMQVLQGRLSQAEVTLQRARLMAVGSDGKPLALVGIADNVFGDILRERNRLDEAKEYLERGHQLTQTEWLLNSLDALVSLARLLQSRGEWDEAQALIAEAFRLSLGTKASQWDEVFIAATAVRLALQRDDRTAAHRWWEQNRLHQLQPEAYPYHVLEYLQLTQARYYLAAGQDDGDRLHLHQALELLQSLLPQAEPFKRVTSNIEILVLRAQVEDALGEADQAVQTLLSALALGEAEDYRRIYLDEGRVMADLLTRCREAQLQSDRYYPSLQYIESLLEDCQREAGIRIPSSTVSVPAGAVRPSTQHEPAVLLSTREMEVLTLIAAGKTNQEIAEQLYLALNTVKRHAYNIYAKLDVKKRTQAVVEARRLGLIP